jgi:hypothetical protein
MMAQLSPEERANVEAPQASTPGDNYSHAQLWQLTQKLGRELPSFDKSGVAGAAAYKTYDFFRNKLQSTADTNGFGKDWTRAKGDYQGWVRDFLKSPLQKVVSGQNATDIMSPLTGKSSEQVKGILEKYRDYGADPDALKQEASRYSVGQSGVKAGHLSGWQMAASAMFPPYGAARIGIPMVMRQPEVMDAISGSGLKNIPPSKVALKLAIKAGKEALAPTSAIALAGSKK